MLPPLCCSVRHASPPAGPRACYARAACARPGGCLPPRRLQRVRRAGDAGDAVRPGRASAGPHAAPPGQADGQRCASPSLAAWHPFVVVGHQLSLPSSHGELARLCTVRRWHPPPAPITRHPCPPTADLKLSVVRKGRLPFYNRSLRVAVTAAYSEATWWAGELAAGRCMGWCCCCCCAG